MKSYFKKWNYQKSTIIELKIVFVQTSFSKYSNIPSQNIRYQIREQIDFAAILYNKGLYKQSLKILDKTKIIALENDEKYMALKL
jgi:hypothetical protein